MCNLGEKQQTELDKVINIYLGNIKKYTKQGNILFFNKADYGYSQLSNMIKSSTQRVKTYIEKTYGEKFTNGWTELKKFNNVYEVHFTFPKLLSDVYEVKEGLSTYKEKFGEIPSVSLENEELSYFDEVGDYKVRYSTTTPINNDLKEGLQWLKQVMPDVEPKLVDGLIDNVAIGSYDILNDLITLSKDFANKSVVKEEAFHKIFNLLPNTEQEKLLNEGSKKYGIPRGKSTATVKYSQSDQNKVDFGLKSVEILQSDKAKQIFDKGEKNNWDLNKILTELQVPKEQKQLILDLGIINREQIVLELASNYSYTIEINTTTINQIGDKVTYNPETDEVDIDFIEPDFDYEEEYDDEGNIIGMKPVLSNKGKKQLEEQPTQYYSNLTVPGGTNYTENEIATPAITPSIKGHAQFATDKGIGWFRSDEEQSENDLLEQREEEEFLIANNPNYIKGSIQFNKGEGSKTRRILEVQSDLFQKGRDKKDLISGKELQDNYNAQYNDNIETFYDADNNRYFKVEDGKETTITEKEFNSINSPKESSKNQFLQLLNKNNNWVTFFVKSIIQDSAKKGYEKVLFPSGNTASKVEGHTTLEEFKKQKEDRLKELENKVSKGKYIFIDEFGNQTGSAPIEADMEILKKNNPSLKIEKDSLSQQELNSAAIEITQLKQELERVEREGFGALRPIYNFYENTVTNILNKTYGKENVKLIADEYGNTWNEITITPKMSEIIRLNTPKGKIEYTGDLAIEEKIAEEAYNSKDEKVPTTLIGKFIQSIRNMLRNIYKEKDNISRLIRDLNQGRYKENNKNFEEIYEKILSLPEEDVIDSIKKCLI